MKPSQFTITLTIWEKHLQIYRSYCSVAHIRARTRVQTQTRIFCTCSQTSWGWVYLLCDSVSLQFLLLDLPSVSLSIRVARFVTALLSIIIQNACPYTVYLCDKLVDFLQDPHPTSGVNLQAMTAKWHCQSISTQKPSITACQLLYQLRTFFSHLCDKKWTEMIPSGI